MLAKASVRPLPVDLFAALARFVTEYPQLQPAIGQLTRQGPPASVEAVRAFSQIIGDAAVVWPAWNPPRAANGQLDAVRLLSAAPGARSIEPEVWHFSIQNQEGSQTGELQIESSWSRDNGLPPWPTIAHFTKISEAGNKAIYQPDADIGSNTHGLLEATWADLFVLDYQNMRPSAYTLRNQNLAVPPDRTNQNFVYRTETVTWPTPVVPLITAATLIELKPPTTPDSSLKAAIQSMLTQLLTPPDHSVTNGSNQWLEFESPIDYRYDVFADPDQTAVYADVPVFLVSDRIRPGEEQAEAGKISGSLKAWRIATGASSDNTSLRFRLTIFASTIAAQDDRLPLVQFQELVIPAKNDDSWW
jgi:hypothetical protein